MSVLIYPVLSLSAVYIGKSLYRWYLDVKSVNSTIKSQMRLLNMIDSKINID
ncbi:hypothetical protein [Deminuibacter soli]|uniref:hypothetical protein n=1 Tax=Deminuibacter soli TaxID=2291815 RepID=UPI0013146DFC|nr:hypothetical protein [Deminuibacter soli]